MKHEEWLRFCEQQRRDISTGEKLAADKELDYQDKEDMANQPPYTDSQNQIIRNYYEARKGKPLAIEALCLALGRSYWSVAMQASRLGLAERNRPKSDEMKSNLSVAQIERFKDPAQLANQSRIALENIAKNGHPRGFKGKKRTAGEKAKMKAASLAAWANPNHRVNSKEYRQGISDRMSKLASTKSKENAYSNAKSGWVEVGGQRFFSRSKWEANYGRYLEFLKTCGEILHWEHEPVTFWFHKIKRGVRSYLPDFRVTQKDGSFEYHEVKGWMDRRSKTKIKRMKKYYPAVTLVVRDEKWYSSNSKKLKLFVKGWV